MPLKMLVKLIEVGPDRMVQRSVFDFVTGRLLRPGKDFLKRTKLMADLFLAEISTQAVLAEPKQFGRRVAATGNGQRGRVLEQRLEIHGRSRRVRVTARR